MQDKNQTKFIVVLAALLIIMNIGVTSIFNSVTGLFDGWNYEIRIANHLPIPESLRNSLND